MKKLGGHLFDALRKIVCSGRSYGFTGWENQRGTTRACVVGWLVDAPKAHFLWDGPRRLTANNGLNGHAKSATRCPAIVDFDARLIEVPCPIDLRLGFGRDAAGKPVLVDLDGDASGIRPRHLQQMVTMAAEKEWRSPDRPMIQITTPYVFLADEAVWMSQMPPFASHTAARWPGLVIGGRLPVHLWPRQLLWAFEWWDVTKEIHLKRGEPWFYLQFETNDPSRRVRVVEAEMTAAVREYLDGLASVTNYVNRTFSLFRTASRRRPKTLLFQKKR